MKVLVTGADGFVGQHLLAELLEHDHAVSASSRDLPPRRTTLSPAQSTSVDWKAADVRDHDALYRLIAATLPDHIYHLAGFSSGFLARHQAAEALHVNVGGTVNLCEAVAAVRAEKEDFDPRILVMGSGQAYGDAARSGVPLTEEMGLRPVSTYGLSKAAQELAAHTYRRASGLRLLVVRAFNMIGPGQELPFVVPEFCAQVAAIARGEAEPAVRVGNLEIARDFVDVRDAVRAFRLVMSADEPGAAYNIASGVAVRIRTVLDWILDEAGVQPEIRVDPSRMRTGEVASVTGDASRVTGDTGWTPARDVEATVREVYHWMARRHMRPEEMDEDSETRDP